MRSTCGSAGSSSAPSPRSRRPSPAATAEALLGRFESARARAGAVIAEKTALGVTGLQLGHAYDVAARIAIAERDADAFRTYAALAREQYRPGKSSVLGSLYERLVD